MKKLKNSLFQMTLSDGHKRVYIAWSIILFFYFLSLFGVLFRSFDGPIHQIVNRDYNGEGFIEDIEAIAWLLSSILYIYCLIKAKTNRKWLIFLALLCFVAFGEEISWGQNIFGINPPEIMNKINKQHEINIHNLNISYIIGLEPNTFIYNFLKNANTLLNPLFYTLCGLLWFVIPAYSLFYKRNLKLFSSMPMPSVQTVYYLGINMAMYIIIDKYFFDVGELFELALALSALLVSFDVYAGYRSPSLEMSTSEGLKLKPG